MPDHYPHKGPQGFFTSDDESIYFESYGQGEAVILCHGLGGNHAIWYQQVPHLAQNYQVITWDQRGFGRSSNKAGLSSPATAIRDLKALMKHLKLEQAHLIGQSMGGWAVLGFALEQPQQTQSLVLADTIGGIYTPKITAAYDAYNQNRPSPPALPFGHHPAIGEQFPPQNLTQAFLYSQIGSIAAPPPTAAMFKLLRQTAYPLNAIQHIDIPTLFIVGSSDPIFPPAIIAEASTKIPHAQFIKIPQTGHSPYFEAPTLWNKAVSNFLSRSRE